MQDISTTQQKAISGWSFPGAICASLFPGFALTLFMTASTSISTRLGFAAFFATVIVPIFFIVGLPLTLMLLNLELFRWWTMGFSGALVGVVAVWLLGGASSFFAFLLYGALGAISALIYWFFLVRKYNATLYEF